MSPDTAHHCDRPDRRHDFGLPAADRARRGARPGVEATPRNMAMFLERRRGGSGLPTSVELTVDVEPSLAGRSAADRVSCGSQVQVPAGARTDGLGVATRRRLRLTRPAGPAARAGETPRRPAAVASEDVVPGMEGLDHGSVVVAAITSCTTPRILASCSLPACWRGMRVRRGSR